MSDPAAPVIVWFRNDLRLADHEALSAAATTDSPVLACYVLDEYERPPGAAGCWWLHHSLAALGESLRERGIELVLRRGRSAAMLTELAAATSARTVHAIASGEPDGARLETDVAAALASIGVELHRHPGVLLFDVDTIRTAAGKPFQVFTPFWKACLAHAPPAQPLPVPRALEPYRKAVASDALEAWSLRPRAPDWAAGFASVWTPGEAGAHARLDAFIDAGVARYAEDRDRPDLDATSRLSPYLHFGEISPRQIWQLARSAGAARPGTRRGVESFLRELGWREFSYHLLHHWPTLPSEPFREAYAAFPWRHDSTSLEAWQHGRTGYPIVDAGMRQLWSTGWMHNRVRMVVASFLVKHLLIPWQRGAAWFLDTLVDADLANNSASWQWVAGSGADAAPYFRIFNPILQGSKFDPAGRYVRQWVPELGALPDAHIHAPWAAPARTLEVAGVVLGRDYPHPIVDHASARTRALAAYRKLKSDD